MCIIVAVKKKSDFPNVETITECMERNRHGAGFMYVGHDSRVHITKGYNSPAEIMERVTAIPEDSPIVFHARIATHGAVTPENCHPFPVTTDEAGLKLTHLSCTAGFAHNGVFHEYSTASTASGFPDSVEFMRSVIVPILKDIENPSVQFLLRRVVSSGKIAILTPKSLLLFGDFTVDGPVYYSNLTYKPAIKYTYPKTDDAWDDHEYRGYYSSRRQKDIYLPAPTGNVAPASRVWMLTKQYGLSQKAAKSIVDRGLLWE